MYDVEVIAKTFSKLKISFNENVEMFEYVVKDDFSEKTNRFP